VFTTFEGDNTVLLQLVAKGLLTGYRDAFGALDTLGTVRFVARQVVGVVAERTQSRALARRLLSAAPGRAGEGDLRDRGVQLRLFVDREQHVLDSLAQRMRRVASSSDPFTGFNEAQDHLLKAAVVHTDRIVMEAFAAAVERCTDPLARDVLSAVADLHALSTIESDLAWFLVHGRLTPSTAKAVSAAVNALCGELRPHARALVDGFGIPDEWLGASIATGVEAERHRLAGTAEVMG
jgi:acyl-CoA oxidase